jgi:putative flippase GtrA
MMRRVDAMAGPIAGQALRFAIVGAGNTALTYALFLLLALRLPPGASYALAYAVGIGISFAVNRTWVFRSTRRWSAIIPFAALQLALLGLGSALTAWFARHLDPWLAGLCAIAVIVPLSFFANRAVLKPTRTPP